MKRFVVPLLFGFALARTARAEEAPAVAGRPLRLEELLASVDRSFPLLKAAELEQAIADGDARSAEGGFDVAWKTRATVIPVGYYESTRIESTVEKPTAIWGITPFAGWRLGRGEFPIYYGQLQTLEYGELRAGLNVPLWRNGPTDRRRASLERAELGRRIASLSITQQRIEYRRAAAHRYWTWAAAGRRLAIANELLDNVVARDAGLEVRVSRGDLPPIERTDNARAIEQRKSQVALAARNLEQASIELGLFWRDDTGRPLSLADRTPPALPEPGPEPSVKADLDAAAAQRPEPTRFALTRKQSQVELDWAENQRALGIDLQLAGSQDVGRAMPSRPDLSKPVFEASVLVDVPLQTRQAQGRADAATATLRRAEQQQAFAKERIEADVRDAHSAIRRSRERLGAARREVSLARELESAERLRFEQGDSHLLTVNIREQQTAEAELREVDALMDYHRAVADLRAARGE